MYQVSKSFQILKNIQFKKITGKTLFEHQIEICVREVIASEKVDRELKFDLFAILLSLLEEIEQIKDIRTEVPIDKLLDYAKDEKFYLKILDGKITAEEIEKHEKELKPKIYFVDDILASFLIYWTQSDLNYDEYKQKFIELGTYFEMFIDIIEGNDEKLIRNFLESVKKIEKVFQVRYQKVSYEPNDVTNFLANLLFAAIRHGRTNVIDRIFDYENFITTEFQFPPNMRCDKTTRYVTTQLLQNGIELGSETIPENWLLPQDFEKFLDSRINYNNQDLIEIDTSFMIHRKTRKQHIESNTDVDNNNMFWEDTRSLEYIVENKLLKEFVTHPVISTYIDLKTFKHQRILLWNFFMFLCFLILIFAFVIAYSSYGSSSKIWNFILFPIVVLSLREYFQLSCIDETWKNYLKKTSNRIEICLIFFLTLTWILSLIESGSIAEFTDLYIIDYIVFFSLEDVIKFLKITSIFLTTGSFLLTLPFGSMQVYMMMVKKVAKNFFKFFFAMCFSILFAYAVSFRLIFSSSFEKNPKEALKLFGNETEAFDEFTTLESATEEPNNFERFDSALLKVVMMLSGEFGIEPVTLTFFQIIFFASFVLMSFILFNLILGMAIDNVQTLQSEARKLILTKNAKRFIEAHKLCYKVYKNLRLDVFETSELSRFQRVKVWILRHGLSTSPTIHKLDKFYVNLKTHKISMTINGTQEQIINESINSDAFDKIKEILRK